MFFTSNLVTLDSKGFGNESTQNGGAGAADAFNQFDDEQQKDQQERRLKLVNGNHLSSFINGQQITFLINSQPTLVSSSFISQLLAYKDFSCQWPTTVNLMANCGLSFICVQCSTFLINPQWSLLLLALSYQLTMSP